ncbi:MAG: zf-HC2 domain-containing protein [Candidatus Solibacter usitatus]|nr:zf-HC2 domain-containing protein [Candidatus Solibacter usitatus]
MSCSPFDLRDYFLQELDAEQAGQVDRHVKTCAGCRDELDRLRITGVALASLRDEEIPQRIAFVSDKVFEPSLARGLWRDFWGSAARLGFASATVLAGALIFFASHRPAGASLSESEIAQRVQAAVQSAIAQNVAQLEARQTRQTAELLAAAEERYTLQRQADMRAVDDQISVIQKRYNVMLMASNDFVKGTR